MSTGLVGHRRRDHAGQPAQVVDQRGVELLDRRLRSARQRRIEREADDVLGVEARPERLQVGRGCARTARRRRPAGSTAPPAPPPASCAAARAGCRRRRRSTSSLSARLRSTAEPRSAGARPKSTAVSAETTSVKVRTRASGVVDSSTPNSSSGSTPTSRSPSHAATSSAGDAAERGDQRALDQRLAHQAGAAGADRQPHAHLPLPAGGPRQHQVGDVGAGDEQHQADHAHQHRDRPRQVAADLRQPARGVVQQQGLGAERGS